LIVLSIDQATHLSGYSVMNEREELITYGIINLDEDSRPMFYFKRKIIELINKYNPDVICWEDLKSDRNADTIRKLGKMVGILQELCEELEISYKQYIPVSIRAKLCDVKTGTGGRGTKFDLARKICKLYNINYPTKKDGSEITNAQHEFFNKSDAIGIGLYHIRYGENRK
jgi:Holliday junction resolvasome RuvABC endonuclease subunit